MLSIMTALDPTDARILLALDDNPQATVVALAEQLGLARNTVHARLRRMESLGPHSRRVEPEALGYPLMALMTLSISQRDRSHAATSLGEIAEVIELLATTGDGDLLARVVARDTTDLHRVTESILAVPGVVRTSTAIVLRQVVPLRLSPLLRRLAAS
ncbi:AsnC family transcriptional regulator [Paractinoplanes durhamensis]|uniref:AsnC family transcriptional regulator n=2 Tax=Paractinoplanes durhamensis TaxID=113563 RepID=A0ABQ3YZR2_9ACTN|nr:AsnC family transcriptional regulator [Actinoplanes durhamensis]